MIRNGDNERRKRKVILIMIIQRVRKFDKR